MEELVWIINIIRQIEALLLPVFPASWRARPPSYRLIMPLLDRIAKHQDKAWGQALMYTVRYRLYPPYHEWGYGCEGLSPAELWWMRAVAVFITLASVALLTPWEDGLRLYMLCALACGGVFLAIYAAMNASIATMWAAWGVMWLTFINLIITSLPGMAIWSLIGLIWHVSLLSRLPRWRWYHVLATWPMLLFWWRIPSGFLTNSGWEIWQAGLATVILWALIWGLLYWRRTPEWLRRTACLYWPASLVMFFGIVTLHRWLLGAKFPTAPLWFMWAAGSFLPAGLAVVAAPLLRKTRALFSWPVVLLACCAYFVLAMCVQGKIASETCIELSLLSLHQSFTPMWYFCGAMIMLFLHRTAIASVYWAQALLPRWFLPAILGAMTATGICCIQQNEWFRENFYAFYAMFGEQRSMLLAVEFTLAITVLVAYRQEGWIRQCLFWGLLAYLLIEGYQSQVTDAVTSDSETGSVSTGKLLKWMMVIIWIAYVYLGEQMNSARKRLPGISAMGFTAAMMCFLVALPWLGQDTRSELQKEISYNLLQGVMLFGIPLVIYSLVVRERLAKHGAAQMPADLSADVHWGWVLIVGIIFVQVLLGFEHYVAAWMHGIPMTEFQEYLVWTIQNTSLTGANWPQLHSPAWVLFWRISRWMLAMGVLTLLFACRGGKWSRQAILFTCVFTSLAISTAESIRLDWPGLDPAWSELICPWHERVMLWDETFLQTYLTYIAAGVAWGLPAARWLGLHVRPAEAAAENAAPPVLD